MEPSGSTRLTPAQRRQLEEIEAQREADRLADHARQRETLQSRDEDEYVAQRMQREREAIEAEIQAARDEEERQSGGVPPTSPYVLLAVGILLAFGVLIVIYVVGR